MKKTIKGSALIALSAGVALIATGCTAGSTASTAPSGGDASAAPVTMPMSATLKAGQMIEMASIAFWREIAETAD